MLREAADLTGVRLPCPLDCYEECGLDRKREEDDLRRRELEKEELLK